MPDPGASRVSLLTRRAVPGDADAIATVVFAVAQHAWSDLAPRQVASMELEDVAGEWRHRLDPPDLRMGEDLVVVAELGGRVVGVASWTLVRSRRDQPVGWGELTHLAVHPAAQNSGVGSVLLAAAEDALATERGDRPTLTARLQMHEDAWWAAGFLERRGWTRDPEDPPADVLPNRSWTRSW